MQNQQQLEFIFQEQQPQQRELQEKQKQQTIGELDERRPAEDTTGVGCKQRRRQVSVAAIRVSPAAPFVTPTNAAANNNNTTLKGRPLSISSISSAASSNSSGSSANSSVSSGIQSSLTRNGSLNYGLEYRRCAYLASIESLNSSSVSSAAAANNAADIERRSVEETLKNLKLTPSGHFKDAAAARAAILAAGAQSRSSGQSPGNRIPRINRSFHASLRYDKNTAYRIHSMASARNQQQQLQHQQLNSSSTNSDESTYFLAPRSGGGSISRNNSSTSSDSGHHRQQVMIGQQASAKFLQTNSRFLCQCGVLPATISKSSSSAPQVAGSGQRDEDDEDAYDDDEDDDDVDDMEQKRAIRAGDKKKAATLDSGSCQRSSLQQQQKHHPDCSYLQSMSMRGRPKRASAKLQPSPSSASSHSNTSSLFRDDGFEDDLMSSASEQMSTYLNQHHRLSFQGSLGQSSSRRHYRQYLNQFDAHLKHHLRRNIDDDDEYQSCEEEFSNSQTTATSTTSNLDDCALSTTSSALMQHDQSHIVLDQISLANAKKEYRKSLLLEHQQQQHLLHAQHTTGQQNKIQSLVTTAPNLCQLSSGSNGIPISQSANTTANSNTSSCISPTNSNCNIKPTKCDDRTVNIIGHMPTKSPGYWDSNLSITQRVVTEIIETERTYVDDLEQIVTGYICYLRNVLKQQKQQQQQQQQHYHHQTKNSNDKMEIVLTSDSINEMVNDNRRGGNNNNSTEDDDKSLLVFDDDATSATNEVVDDYDVEETDNLDLGIKENHDILHVHHNKSIAVNKLHDNPNAAINNISKIASITTPNSTDGAIMTANHIKNLFSNLEDIYKFNKDLLFRLEECYLNPSSVAECFVENASGFEIYTHYCTMYPQVVSTLTELMANQTSAQLLKERQNELNQSLPLGAYLLKPVQRILKYHILFQSLIKHTTDDEAVNEKDRQLIGEAFSVMTSIACHINAMKKRHEHAIRVQEVQGLLSGWEGPDLTTLGELILEDTFKLYNRPKSSRHLFLFDSVLLITKKKRDGSLCYKGHIACSNLMLIEKIEGQPLVFNTVPFDNPKALCAFQAKHLDKKRDWCLHMKELIIKSYEVKIPVHARDILMSLTNSGSNSTDSNTPSSKHSSETARAIRAPNYLEKKKRAKLDKKK